MKNVNCIFYKNHSDSCTNKKVRRSIFGVGSRVCSLDTTKCKHCEPYESLTERVFNTGVLNIMGSLSQASAIQECERIITEIKTNFLLDPLTPTNDPILNLTEMAQIDDIVKKAVVPFLTDKENSLNLWNKFISDYLSLRHYRTTSSGLWVTDRPDLIPENLRENFFELK